MAKGQEPRRMTAQETIEQREATHGDYRLQASAAQALKDIMRASPGWEAMTPAAKESCDMIAVKLSRVVNGSPDEPDHWTDIAGYATLVSNLLTKGTHL